jgi:hypothetical protein
MRPLLLFIVLVCLSALTYARRPQQRSRVRGTTNATQPQQVHIGFAGSDENGNSNGMVISWNTASATATSTVLYGLESKKYTWTANGTQNTYIDSYNHHVVLQNLTLDTRYYYICGDAQGGYSDEFSFVTAISQPRPFIVNVYGDMGLTDGDNTRAQVIKQLSDVDFIWHVGDMSYADDDILGWQYEQVWDEFMNTIQPISSVRPYMVLPGNHEAECHFLGCLPFSKTFYALRNFTAYRHRFRMPCEESGGTENMWYSFNYGQAHFVSISTETDYPGSPEGQGSLANDGPFGDQLGWLEADLARADSPTERAVRPWVFVAGHRPIYSVNCIDSSQKPNGACKSLQTAIEDLLKKYHVDIFFTGHVHSYQRTVPVYQGVPTPGSPIYIVHGAAGNVEGHEGLSNTAAWLATKDDQNFGYGRLSVYNATTLQWTVFRDSDNAVIDDMVLSKQSVIVSGKAPRISIA